jgi:hypothetical protein
MRQWVTTPLIGEAVFRRTHDRPTKRSERFDFAPRHPHQKRTPYLVQENPASLEQALKSLRAQAAESTAKSLVGDRAQLLRHREAILFETTF